MNLEKYQEVLENNYQENIKLFKKYMPSTLNVILEQHVNDKYALELDKEGLNISYDGENIYPSNNTKEYFNFFLEEYYKRDKLNLIEYDIGMTYYNDQSKFDDRMIEERYHHHLTKNYIDIFHRLPDISKLDPYHEDRYAMVIFGIGLGYHIPELIKKYNIRQLVIVDVDYEMLKSSLYTLMWKDIFEYFDEKDKFRSLKIIIEDDSEKLNRSLLSYYTLNIPMAYYNLSQFISYDNEIFKETIKLFTKSIKMVTGGAQGFVDDEKWSIQHTIQNVNNNIPILSNDVKGTILEKPVFVIANGPSLDKYMDIVKKHKDKAIIIAAGSALSSLYKNGITPDYLVQVERTFSTYEHTLNYASKDYLKDITFIGMNCIHPRVYTLFNKSFMFLKANDSGSKLIKKDNIFPELIYSNPTVSNGALATALYLGFKDIYLFGMDFGYKSVDDHHSKDSVYYNKKLKVSDVKKEKEIEVEGIDGDIIYTEKFYNDSRKNIESLLTVYSKDLDINVSNFSHGAKVLGTNPTIDDKRINRYKDMNSQERDTYLTDAEKYFKEYEYKILIDYEEIDNNIKYIQSTILACKQDNLTAFTYLNLTKLIYTVFNNQLKNKDWFRNMIRGSFLNYMSKIYIYSSFQEQDERVSKYINNSLDMLADYLDELKQVLHELETQVYKPF